MRDYSEAAAKSLTPTWHHPDMAEKPAWHNLACESHRGARNGSTPGGEPPRRLSAGRGCGRLSPSCGRGAYGRLRRGEARRMISLSKAAPGPCHGRRLHLMFCRRCRLTPTCTTSIGRSRTKRNSAVHSPGRVVVVQENDPGFECLRVCTFVRASRRKPFIVSFSQGCSA